MQIGLGHTRIDLRLGRPARAWIPEATRADDGNRTRVLSLGS